ncbi:MAG: hypothetical protein K0S61_2633 [Anaerocolumna sp.]|jgi:hypothetical protein|nr:hypothetical protein [Anaerocolumna sp.]
MRKNQIISRLLKHTEKNLNHFLDRFSDQVINNEASLFLGTGVSMNSGYPSWKELLRPCAEELDLNLDNESDLYAIAQFYANKHSDAELRKLLSSKINTIKESNELLENLLDVGFNSIWTTNYDKLIENELNKNFIANNVIFSDRNLSSIDRHDKINIYKMNGDISDPTNMIVTKNDYENYLKEHSLFLTFLKKELVANTFLFVGYSFTDDIVLNCLSALNDFLGDSGNNHYALMIVDQKTNQRFEYFVEDLKKRYGINCIFAEKDDLPIIIKKLNQRIREKKIFISGAYDTVPNDVDKKADNLSRELVNHLYGSDYRLVTGVGKRLGTFITGYAHQYLAEKNKPNPPKYLSMRPFPFHLNLNEEKKIQYREIMQRDCSASIFLFGESKSTTQLGSYEKTGHYSQGVYQEFEIAKKFGHTIIPVGSTGYESEIIWNEVKANINQYYYLSKKIDKLKSETDPSKLAKLIVAILDEVSKNRRINQK